jgi:RND superfamily putative drug exporter
MKKLAQFCYKRRKLVLPAWIALLVGIIALSSAVSGEFASEFSLPGAESQRAFDLLEDRGLAERTGEVGQIVFQAPQGVNDPAVRSTMERLFAETAASVEEIRVASPYEPGNEYQISADGTIAYAEISFSQRKWEVYQENGATIRELVSDLDIPGVRIALGGEVFAGEPEFNQEFIGLIAAVFILLIAFGSLIAMGLPIMTALFGIGCGVSIIAILTRVLAIPDFTTQVAMMIGIGVGIDYALLIVTRYRAALHDGMEPADAVVLALDTSGRAVLFAAVTVVIAMAGMLFLNLEFIRGMALSVVLAVLLTMLASLTLLPAMLGFAGRNIDKLGLPHRASKAESTTAASFWFRWSRLIQRYPWPALIASTALLVVLVIPLFSLRLGFSDAGNRPETNTTRQAYDMLSEAFGPGFNGSILLVTDLPNGSADLTALQRLETALRGAEGVASVTPVQEIPGANVALMTVFPTTAPQDAETTDLVHHLRGQIIPAAMEGTGLEVMATGLPPVVVDFSDYTADRMPIFVGAVLLLSFLLLMTVFHSLVVPIKAVIMNLLGIGAAFGATVAVFQWGFLGGVFGVGKEGPIEAWAPMMLFAIVFGLSMDYEVFLLTRIREEYDRSGNNGRAVADGLAATGRVITAAALIMVFVFGSFILSNERPLQLMGFGLSFAVLLDATVVRMILVPSAMELMGRANWWAPAWLVRYLPTIRVDTVETPATPLVAAEAAVEQAPAGGGGA